VRDTFGYGYFGHAYKVDEFEKRLAAYIGANYVVATNNGTSALHLAMDALGIGSGDEVIVPSITFIACFQAISATGAKPVACDIEHDTLLINLDDVKKRITKRTKAIMAVHYAGSTCNISDLLQFKERYGLHIIEDAAHAIGSKWEGHMVGSIGDIVCFSFDSIKNITCGEGGAIICRDKALAELIKQKRMLGVDKLAYKQCEQLSCNKYTVLTQGYRYHMSNINAAIGVVQLAKINHFIERRRGICCRYNEAFQNIPGIQVLQINLDETAPHIYVIRVNNGRRDALMKHLKRYGIETAIHYYPNHLYPMYMQRGLKLEETDRAYEEILTLPLHCRLTDEDVNYVSETVSNYLRHEL
jgi:perosamine synthetase